MRRRSFLSGSLLFWSSVAYGNAVEAVGPRVPVGPRVNPGIPQGAITIRRVTASQSRVNADIQNKANASPEGAVLALEGGVYYPSAAITLKNRQQLWGQADTVIDGNGKQRAFNLGNRSGVVLANFGVRNYAPLGDSPAIEGGQSAWGTAQNLDIGGITGCGIRVSTMKACRLHDISVVGYSIFNQSAATIEDCVIEKINPAKRLSGIEGGGKSWDSVNSVIRHCRFSEIYGNCCWFDFNNDLAVVEWNDFRGGVGHGVFLEIGYRAKVQFNAFSGVRNKGTQGGDQRAAVAIVKTQGVQGSTGADVYRNLITDCSIGIGIFEERMETGQSPLYDSWQTKNAMIHENELSACDSFGGFWNWGGDASLSSKGNKWVGNRYSSPRSAKPFQFQNASLAWPQWQAKGQDAGGTLG